MKKSFINCAESNVGILDDLIPLLHSFKSPNIEQTFIEPFLGSGVVFLNIEKYDNFILNDKNIDIFVLFNYLKSNNETFTKELKELCSNKPPNKSIISNLLERYYKTSDYYEKCKLFVFLNSFGVNYVQLEDENKKKLYLNKNNYCFSIKKINYFINKLNTSSVSLFNYSFERIFENLDYGDIVYCDPPSRKEHFSIEQHKLLNKLAWSACLKGIKVIVSHEYNEMNKELYKDCSEYYIKRIKNFDTTKDEMIAIYA